ncbi:MAG: type VI secretion system baseplate subunit TssK [Desulfobacterales bacterium]|jgi:type VI secretion system protein ImpJ|nr:type VI secretion system baseplate subunit TssK [Desulfobacterales bacterium]
MERPLFWHQGLFLQPQHFQLEGLHTRALLTPFHTLLAPHFWGVGEMNIQKSALGNRTFSLLKGEFIFPDATHLTFPGNALIEARSFEKDWEDGGKPLSVLLGIRKWNTTGENVTVLPNLEDISGVTTRFVTTADAEEVIDLHQSGPSAQVKHLYYVLRLFWGNEIDQLGDFVLLPISQLVRTGEEIGFAPGFVPPSLTLTSDETLLKYIKEIRDEIFARTRQLEAYKKSRGIHTAEFGARDMVYLLALRSLNRYVPLLHHFTETRQVHPWQAYGVLRQIVGELSSFSEEVSVMGELSDSTQLLMGYDHRRIGDCFSGAHDLIIRLLNEITAGPDYMIPLLYDGTYFAADLNPAVFSGANRYYLVFETQSDPQGLLQSLETAGKLGARESLPLLIARALPGVRLDHLVLPPQELPRRSFSIYFQIDHHSDLWSRVEKSNNLALYWDTAPEDLKVELMVVGRS